jgi:hypothetical protein|tara:strand:+ start:822 stop:1529 length:708 start_codon:yes stop_codon:yes gene_type:complete
MKKRRKKSKIYFGTPVHDAIVRYNHSNSPSERNKIYTEEIHAAFLKLAENIINTFKFSYFSYGFRDLQEEVVSNLVLNMHKFDETKGSKAFSYFSVVAKNYLILNNNANYKKMKIHDDIDVLYGYGKKDEVIEKNPSIEVFRKTLDYFEENIETFFPKNQDRDIAESILYLCRNKDNIDNFNKKAIYIMIREMTDVKTSKITQVTNTFRKIYPKIQEEVLTRGHIDNLRYTGSLV